MSLDISLTNPTDHSIYEDVPDANGLSRPFNCTHNVVPMWTAAGVYDALYMSEGERAAEILPELKAGLVKFKDPSLAPVLFFLNPSNGWGSYESALKFLERFTAHCERHPDGIVAVWK
jgi:hypothetical protein